MTIHAESAVIMVTRDEVFDLVADVESYPDFLPLWLEVRRYGDDGDTYFTEQEVGLGGINARFRTRTHLVRPMLIEVISEDDLFQDFFIRWDFDTIGAGCRISVALTWQMKSHKLQTSIDRLLPRVARTMVTAFEDRARQKFDATIVSQ